MATMKAEQLTDCRCTLGEGPVWHPETQTLYWIDIESKLIKRLNPQTSEVESKPVPARVGAVVPTTSGMWIAALENGFHEFDWVTGASTPITDPEAGITGTRFNDGKVAPDGSFWAGTMSIDDRKETGSLYRLSSNMQATKFVEGITCSNGLAWTSDASTFYYVDTPTRRVDAFDYDLTSGDISNRRTAFSIPEANAYPDGMCIDAENNLWLGHWGGSAVICYDPSTGRELERIEVDAKNVTSCCFGGIDLTDLYITTARIGTSDEDLAKYPSAGSIFVVKNLTKGAPVPMFIAK